MRYSRDNSGRAASGVGVTGLLGVALIVLKLVGVIKWSWWWVLSPFWIPFVLAVIILLVVAVYAIVKVLKDGVNK